MTLMLKKEEIILQCPFCNKGEFRAVFIPQMIRERKGTWGGRAGRKTVPSKTTVISKCSSCEKSVKELQKAIENKSDELERKKDEEIVKRLRKQEITEIVSKFD